MTLPFQQSGGGGTTPSGPANEIYATPVASSGSAALRAMVTADLPNYVSAATKGFFWGGFLTTPIAAPVSAAISTLVRAMQFVLPYAVTVRKITANLVTGVSTTGLASFGIYDVNGNLLIDSGQFTCGTANVGLVQSVLGTTGGSSAVTTLPAGVYYFAWIGNSTSILFTSTSGPNNTTTTSIFNFGATTSTAEVRLGHSANGYSGTALPGTLGTLTGEGGEAVPYVLFES